jgi:hypothetical protein
MKDLQRGTGFRFYRANAGFFASMATLVASIFLVQGAFATHGRPFLLLIGGVFVIVDALILMDIRRIKRPNALRLCGNVKDPCSRVYRDPSRYP